MKVSSELELFSIEVAGPEPFVEEVARIRGAFSRRTRLSRYSSLEPAQVLAAQEREGKLLRQLGQSGFASLNHARILEIGCGTGNWLRDFVRWGARPKNLRGIDLLPERIAEARALCPAGVTLECGNAARLPIDNASYDLVLQSTVFTSVLDANLKRQIAREMLRVLAAGGLILWYDFCVDNPWNQDVRGVGKAEIGRLFPDCHIDLQRLTLVPPLARPIARFSPQLYWFLSGLKLGATHYLGVIHKV